MNVMSSKPSAPQLFMARSTSVLRKVKLIIKRDPSSFNFSFFWGAVLSIQSRVAASAVTLPGQNANIREVSSHASPKKGLTRVNQQERIRFPHLSLPLPRFSTLNFSARLMSTAWLCEMSLSSVIMCHRPNQSTLTRLHMYALILVLRLLMDHEHICVCLSMILSVSKPFWMTDEVILSPKADQEDIQKD